MGREAVEVGKKLQNIGQTGERDQEGMEEEFFFSPSPSPSPSIRSPAFLFALFAKRARRPVRKLFPMRIDCTGMKALLHMTM